MHGQPKKISKQTNEVDDGKNNKQLIIFTTNTRIQNTSSFATTRTKQFLVDFFVFDFKKMGKKLRSVSCIGYNCVHENKQTAIPAIEQV